MRLAPALKYQLNGIKWPVIIFYIVIYSLFILMGISLLSFRQFNMHVTYGGFDMASMIFLFVVGLNAYKQTFHMFSANGISRKTMFTSFVVTAAILCAGMALVDGVNALIVRQFVNYESALLQIIGTNAGNGAGLIAVETLYNFFGYLACVMLGYFITTAFYRMNKPLKLAISIGVPVFFFILLPIIDAQLFSGEIYKAIGTMLAFCSGRLSGSPYVAMAMDLAFAAVTGTLAYLLARRATVKLSAS